MGENRVHNFFQLEKGSIFQKTNLFPSSTDWQFIYSQLSSFFFSGLGLQFFVCCDNYRASTATDCWVKNYLLARMRKIAAGLFLWANNGNHINLLPRVRASFTGGSFLKGDYEAKVFSFFQYSSC